MEKRSPVSNEKQKRFRRQKVRLGENDVSYSNLGRTVNCSDREYGRQKITYTDGSMGSVSNDKRSKHTGKDTIKSVQIEHSHSDIAANSSNSFSLREEDDGSGSHAAQNINNYPQQCSVVKVEVEDEVEQMSKRVHLSDNDGSPCSSSYQNGAVSQSSQKYFIVERDVPPVQQQYILPTQYTTNTEEKIEPESINIHPTSGMVQRSNSEVPILKKEVGPFKFTVELDEKEDTNKTPSWLMNSKNKLYTNINKAVPFHVKLGEWPPNERDYQVRVTAVFSSHQYARAHVKRCPIHASPQHQTNIDFPFPEHVVRVDHPAAVYEKSVSGRLSVVVPLEQPQAGPLGDTMPLLLRFMCLCSCSGGINRRPLAIIFTLEKLTTLQGKRKLDLYGRQTVDVRVCACPMRDYRNEEGNLPRQDRRCGRKRGGRLPTSYHNHISANNDRGNGIFPHKMEVLSGEELGTTFDELYTLSVRGSKLYDFLLEMKAVYLRHHPEYNIQFPDIEEEIVKFDQNMEEDPRMEDESISLSQESEESLHQQVEMVSSADTLHHHHYEDNNLVLNLENKDCQVLEHEYIESPISHTTVVSNNNSGGGRNDNGCKVPKTMNGQQQQQQQSVHQSRVIQNQITSSNVANLVAQSQMINSMKSSKSLPAGILNGGTSTSSTTSPPVFLIYNPSNIDSGGQFMQTLNTRKIILPRQPMEQQQQTILKNNARPQMSTTSEEIITSNTDNKSQMVDSKAGGNSTEVIRSQYRHIPIANAQKLDCKNVRNKRICMTKKVSRMKQISGKGLSPNSDGPTVTNNSPINVPMPMLVSSQVNNIVTQDQNGAPSHYFITRSNSNCSNVVNNNTSQQQILVPQSFEMKTAYPNLSVVKREPQEYEHQQMEESVSFKENNTHTKREITSLSQERHNPVKHSHPDSDEMLVAQVLASSLGSRSFTSSP